MLTLLLQYVSVNLSDVPDAFTIALTAVFVEGIFFIIISIFKFREAIINGIPQNLKYGITTGIGLFIALIGLVGANIVVADPSTTVARGDFSSPQVVLASNRLLHHRNSQSLQYKRFRTYWYHRYMDPGNDS